VSGYHVRPATLRGQTPRYEEQRNHVEQVRDNLSAAFARDRNTLGHDEYGAGLAKKLPAIEEAVFTALQNLITELDDTSTGLHVTARAYELADRPRQPNS
jgi:hypothetical protein